ncbi:MAG: ABC transporter ATP-binding protein [Pirellulaceae bacterium]|nr:ABC transporter ATP-binding protein [Pirellulaceae bacterium]
MSENVVEVRGLSRRFGKTTALDDVSLSVRPGIVSGLVGENGAGKTTLIKHLLGLFKAQTGSVRIFGLDPVKDPVGVLGRIGYLSEDRDLPDWMRIGELMSYTQAFYPNWDQAFAEQLRETFELSERQRIKSLSRGQRARAGLLVALAHRPDLLVLDEPSSGLDPIVRRDILAAIIRTVADEGRNVLFSSHLLEEVERVADSVTMIHEGKVILSDDLSKIIAAHRLVTVRFKEPQTGPPKLPGMLSVSGEGHEWTVMCNGEIERLKKAVAEAGASIVEDGPASLDDIFVAHAGD